jgi:hypothetical protein
MKKVLALAVMLAVPVTMLAHHGGNLYDTSKAVVLKGATITKFEWGTPHNQIYFDVKNEKGEIVHWVGSTEPAGVMIECGWTRRSLKPGDEATIEIFAAKNGAPVGNLQKVTFADGRVLNGGFGCAAPPKKEDGQ